MADPVSGTVPRQPSGAQTLGKVRQGVYSRPGTQAHATEGRPTVDSVTKWLTKDEAADHLRVKPRTIDRWAEQGKITKYKVGDLQSVRFDRDELDRLIKPAADQE